ncbi:MAG: hypothetical protein ACQEQT_11270 [Chloroflexota bacterium]
MSDYAKPWYHGSPLKIDILREGSSITQNRALARIFSHKPTVVSVDEEEGIKHDGQKPGFLYRIGEKVSPADICPHPRSTMDPGTEWLTTRPLRLDLVCPTQVIEKEQLTERETAKLMRKR